ncbi:MAG: class I SAM-dependent methyltransferase [Candidatus Lindowbacteria bacterium]|nr:class I SAM-dependent methyltransferase [Candidatus Lindowbacteria bacterium]
MKRKLWALAFYLAKLPFVGSFFSKVGTGILNINFKGSNIYWNERYEAGATSGDGSYNELAKFKAEQINKFIEEHNISSVIEFGCGDGNQLGLINYANYTGFDISQKAIDECLEKYANDKTKSFYHVDDYASHVAELTVSLDVVFHLVEDRVFELYMRQLFSSATRYVLIYSTDTNEQGKVQSPHVRHRKFSDWIDSNASEWTLFQKNPNPHDFGDYFPHDVRVDFYIFTREID